MIRKFTYIILFAFLIFGKASFAQDFDNFYKGLAEYRSGDYKNAITYFKDAQKDDLKAEVLSQYIAKCYFELNKIDEAIAEYTVLKEYNQLESSYGLAACFAKKGDTGKSIEELKIYLSQSDKKPIGELKLDKNFNKINSSNEWEKLWFEEWYTKYDQLYDDAKYYYHKSEFARAFETVDELIDKKPRDHRAYELRGLIYEASGDLKKAKDDFSKAISIKKKNPDYYKNLARVYSELGKYKQALENLENAYELDKYNPDYLLLISQEMFNNKKIEDAAGMVTNYLTFFPKEGDAIYLYGKCLFSEEKYSESIERFGNAISTSPAQPKYFLARGNAYLMLNDYEHSIDDFSMALDLNPNLAQAYMSRGIAKLNKDDNESACSDFEKAYKYGYLQAVEMIQQHCNK